MEVQVVINDALQSRRMPIKGKRFLLLSAGLTLFGNTLLAQSGGEKKSFQAFLDGFQEVPPVLTTAEGRFQGKVNDIESEIAYELEYSGMVSHVRAAHIHFGQPGVNGGIMVFLCDNTGAEPGAPAWLRGDWLRGSQFCSCRSFACLNSVFGPNPVTDKRGTLGTIVRAGEQPDATACQLYLRRNRHRADCPLLQTDCGTRYPVVRRGVG